MKEHGTTRKCQYCGGEIDYGRLVTSGSFAIGGITGESVLYSSSKKKGSRIYIGVGTCLSCGHVELFIDPKQLKKSIKNK
jgi:hypothetical protein